MKNLLKLFGVGILTGAGTRAGIMLIEAAFPNGIKAPLNKLSTKIRIFNKEKRREA